MESQAYFTGIREQIIEWLTAATDNLLLAVACASMSSQCQGVAVLRSHQPPRII
jgi:hypothetical protein